MIHMEKAPDRRVPPLKRVFATDLGVLYAGDCLNLLAHVKDEAIDCVFADPPFNLAKDYGRGADKDDLAREHYLEWCFKWIDDCVRVLKPGGSFFIYILPQWGFHFAHHLEQRGLIFRHWIALTMKGTFPRGRKLYPAHYCLLYFCKGDPKTFNHVRLPIPKCRHCDGDIKDYGGHRKYLNPLGINLTDFWEDTAPARHGKFKSRWHINELKPMISGRCFDIATNPGDVVLDPFGGGGSTFEAAQERGRHWIGSELVTSDAILSRFEAKYPLLLQNAPPENLLSVFYREPHAQDRSGEAVQRSDGKNRAAGTSRAAG